MRYRVYEWDMIEGELLTHREYDTEEEAIQALESIIRDAEKRDWDCWYDGSGRYICTKCEEGYCYERELGIEEIY
jgi:hypothetical protein